MSGEICYIILHKISNTFHSRVNSFLLIFLFFQMYIADFKYNLKFDLIELEANNYLDLGHY